MHIICYNFQTVSIPEILIQIDTLITFLNVSILESCGYLVSKQVDICRFILCGSHEIMSGLPFLHKIRENNMHSHTKRCQFRRSQWKLTLPQELGVKIVFFRNIDTLTETMGITNPDYLYLYDIPKQRKKEVHLHFLRRWSVGDSNSLAP